MSNGDGKKGRYRGGRGESRETLETEDAKKRARRAAQLAAAQGSVMPSDAGPTAITPELQASQEEYKAYEQPTWDWDSDAELFTEVVAHAADEILGHGSYSSVKDFVDFYFAPLDTPEKKRAAMDWSLSTRTGYSEMPPGVGRYELVANGTPFVGAGVALRDVVKDFRSGEVGWMTAIDALSIIPEGLMIIGPLVGMARKAGDFGDILKVAKGWKHKQLYPEPEKIKAVSLKLADDTIVPGEPGKFHAELPGAHERGAEGGFSTVRGERERPFVSRKESQRIAEQTGDTKIQSRGLTAEAVQDARGEPVLRPGSARAIANAEPYVSPKMPEVETVRPARQERILAATMKSKKTGKEYDAVNHGVAAEDGAAAEGLHLTDADDANDFFEPGYRTSTGRIVDDLEGADIADAAKQRAPVPGWDRTLRQQDHLVAEEVPDMDLGRAAIAKRQAAKPARVITDWDHMMAARINANPDGGSVNLAGQVPDGKRQRFMVAPDERTETAFERITPEEVAGYREKYADELAKDDMFMGWWENTLDVSKAVPTYERAQDLGTLGGQRMIADVSDPKNVVFIDVERALGDLSPEDLAVIQRRVDTPSEDSLRRSLIVHARPEGRIYVGQPVVGNESVKSLGAKAAGVALMPGNTVDDAMQTVLELYGRGILNFEDEIVQQATAMHAKWSKKLGDSVAERMQEAFEQGKQFFKEDWYDTALPAAQEMFGPEKGKVWAKAWAYTSAGSQAGGSNITYANKALSQILLDQPVHAGRRPNENNALLMRALADVDTPLEVVHHAAKGGIAPAKLIEYSGDISHGGDRSIMDMWINRVSSGDFSGKVDDLTAEGYQVTQALMEQLAKQEGVPNRGYQAADWGGAQDMAGNTGLLPAGDLIRNHPGIQQMLPDEKTGMMLPSFQGATKKSPRLTYRQKYGIPALLAGAYLGGRGGGLLGPAAEEDPALFQGQSLMGI